jgi:diacylglycerol kinase family enzyme
MGTANNVARAIGAEGPESRLAAGLASARAASLSIGVVLGPGETAIRFVEAAGLGVFTRMLRKADDDNVDTMEEGLKLLRRTVQKAKPLSLTIDADGADLSGRYLMLEAMNIPSIGARVLLAPGADHRDERFDLVLITEAERDTVLEYLDALQRGEKPTCPVTSRRVRRIGLGWGSGWGHVDDRPWPPDGEKNNVVAEVTIQVDRHLPLLIA